MSFDNLQLHAMQLAVLYSLQGVLMWSTCCAVCFADCTVSVLYGPQIVLSSLQNVLYGLQTALYGLQIVSYRLQPVLCIWAVHPAGTTCICYTAERWLQSWSMLSDSVEPFCM